MRPMIETLDRLRPCDHVQLHHDMAPAADRPKFRDGKRYLVEAIRIDGLRLHLDIADPNGSMANGATVSVWAGDTAEQWWYEGGAPSWLVAWTAPPHRPRSLKEHPVTLPPLKTSHGRPYRVWTVGLLPVEQLPRFEPGMSSPAFVSNSDWVIHVGGGHLYVALHGVLHELHGTVHASDHDAQRAAYGAGLLGVMVYEDAAARGGFPGAP